MKSSINDIVAASIGYQHREPIEQSSVGSCRAIQIKDIDRDGRFAEFFPTPAPYRLWTGSLYSVTPKGDAERYRVHPGDVLFLSRGHRNFAIPMSPAYVQPFPESWKDIIALYYFYILQIKTPQTITPEYLAWYINQSAAQKYFETNARGSHMKMVPLEVFNGLEVAVPPLATQKKIVELEQLRQKEEKALTQLMSARKKLIQSVSFKATRQH